MKQGRRTLIQLTMLFLLGEILFNYILLSTGNVTLLDGTLKALFFLVLILLFSKGLAWAKWLLSVSLMLYGIMCLVVGFQLMPVFYLIGAYYIFFGVFIHTSKLLSVFRTVSIKTRPSDSLSVISDVQPLQYPMLVKRYKAMLIDAMLLFFVLIIIMVIVDGSEMKNQIMIVSSVIAVLVYEPFLTAYSQTIGQRLMKIRVGKHENPTERISLLNAYARLITKGLLGWISFLTIHFNPERRAVHDLVSNSVMTIEA